MMMDCRNISCLDIYNSLNSAQFFSFSTFMCMSNRHIKVENERNCATLFNYKINQCKQLTMSSIQ